MRKRNWKQYNKNLVKRGSITFFIQQFPKLERMVSVQWGLKNGHFEYFLTQNMPKIGTFDQSSPLKSTICIKKTTPTERIRLSFFQNAYLSTFNSEIQTPSIYHPPLKGYSKLF